jgi:hypothetical protein
MNGTVQPTYLEVQFLVKNGGIEGYRAYDIGCILLQGEYEDGGKSSGGQSTEGPEQRQAMQHLAEVMASLVTKVEALSELGAT